VKLLSGYLNVCDQNPPTLLTDRETERRHSHSNTAIYARTCLAR